MLRKPNITKNNSKSRRQLKKYSKCLTRKDRTFRGMVVYTYTINNNTFFTAKPKQNGAKAHPIGYVKWRRKIKQYDLVYFLSDGTLEDRQFVGTFEEMKQYVSLELRAFCVREIRVYLESNLCYWNDNYQ